MKRSEYDFLIVGAGFYGATFAELATDAGYKVLVIDKRNHIGGNAHTRYDQESNTYIHEYGPHIFHTNDERIWRYVTSFGEFNNYVHSPKALHNGKMYSLPFNMNTFHEIFKTITPQNARRKIERDRVACDDIRTVEDYALHHVGKSIYEKLIKGYTEKQWQRPCNELPASIIKRLPLRFTYDSRYFNDRYQGIPTLGYTDIIRNMLAKADVQLNVDFNLHRETYLKLADNVVYSGSIDDYFDHQFGTLEYRSLEFEHRYLPTDEYTYGCAVVNFTNKEVPYTRVTQHDVFNPDLKSNGHWLSFETSVEWDQTRERYYPINNERNQAIYNQYRDLAKTTNTIFGGRLGKYRYYDMHQAIGAAWSDFSKWLTSHPQS